jgi:hypothetical protein
MSSEGEAADRVGLGRNGPSKHLDRLERLPGLTQEWAAEYDVILVDLPPLLVSADAEILVRSLGHVIVVIEADSQIVGEIKRARRLLQKLDPPAIGLIVNRIRPFDGGGYLQSSMLEHLTGLKPNEYYSTSSWELTLHSLLLELELRFPRAGQLVHGGLHRLRLAANGVAGWLGRLQRVVRRSRD